MELTTQMAKKAAKWFLNNRGLEDWTIRVLISDKLSDDWGERLEDGADDNAAGLAICLHQRKEAWVWVSPKLCDESAPWHPNGIDPWAVFFHECCHVWARSLGIENDEGSTEMLEQAWHADGAFFASVWQGLYEDDG